MNVEIRAAVEADAEGVIALYREFTQYLSALGDEPEGRLTAELFRRQGFCPDPAFHALVAEGDGGLSGYLLYHLGFDADQAMRVMHIVDLYVADKHRGQGVGSALMARGRSICRECGAIRMLWSVHKANRSAKRFYERLGAEIVDDLDFMCLDLD